jgi:elongation factor Tu
MEQINNNSFQPFFFKSGREVIVRILIYGAISGGLCLAAGMFLSLLTAYAFGFQKSSDLAGSEVYLVGTLIVLVYLILGISGGVLLAWTGILISQTDTVESKLQNDLNEFIPHLVDKYKIGTAGIEVKTMQRLLETDEAGFFASLSWTRLRFSLTRMLHAWVVKKTVSLFRLGLGKDFIDWMGEKGKQRATVSDLELFSRELLVKKGVGIFEAQVSGFKKRILTVLITLVALPFIANAGSKLYIRHFPGPAALIAHFADQYQDIKRQFTYLDTLQGLQIKPNCQPYRHKSGARSRFERTKPHVNMYLMGHTHLEKIVLTSAITKVMCERGLAQFMPFEQLMDFPVESDRGLNIRTAHVEYYSKIRHYAHVIGYSHLDDIRNLITGAVHADGAILSIPAAKGNDDELRRMVKLAKQCGIDHVVVFIDLSVVDPDARRLQKIVTEIKALLKENGFPGLSPIISGSPLKALKGETGALAAGSIAKLVDAIDTHIPKPINEIDRSFMMPVEDCFIVLEKGLVVTGKIRSGRIRPGDTVEIIGLQQTRRVTVNSIEMYRKLLGEAQAGDTVGIVFKDLNREDVLRGQLLVQPGTMQTALQFEALVYMLSVDEKGRHISISEGYRPQFYFWTTVATGTLVPQEGVRQIDPGAINTIRVKLVNPVAMSRGTRFAIREGGRTVGAGVVTELF